MVVIPQCRPRAPDLAPFETDLPERTLAGKPSRLPRPSPGVGAPRRPRPCEADILRHFSDALFPSCEASPV